MFTGIIETLGQVVSVKEKAENLIIEIESSLSNELKVDQSISHNGVCLTVEAVNGNKHQVSAIRETLSKSNLSDLEIGNVVNLERCLRMDGRLDGHFVQGHVDTTLECTDIRDESGSFLFTFKYNKDQAPLLISHGSVCLNGVSLTIARLSNNEFSVAIIPYTFENTSFRYLQKGMFVNVEFDLLGKYLLRQFELKS